MAKPPRLRSFNESHLRALDYKSAHPGNPDVPHGLARALVRGLLAYFSTPGRRSKLDSIDMGVLEESLMADITQRAASDGNEHRAGYTNDEVNRIADTVPEHMKLLLAHPIQSVLAEEGNRLIPLFKGYASLHGVTARKTWLKQNVPAILTELFTMSRCPLLNCPRRRDIPMDNELGKWAEHNGGREASFRILAHHHGSTYDVVKDHFARRAPRRSPANKPPNRSSVAQ